MIYHYLYSWDNPTACGEDLIYKVWPEREYVNVCIYPSATPGFGDFRGNSEFYVSCPECLATSQFKEDAIAFEIGFEFNTDAWYTFIDSRHLK